MTDEEETSTFTLKQKQSQPLTETFLVVVLKETKSIGIRKTKMQSSNQKRSVVELYVYQYLGSVSISPDIIIMMVPGGCCSQVCHGYLHTLHVSLVAPLLHRHPPQAHLLVMSLIISALPQILKVPSFK